jgi:3D (Asp-Asp-Asp) domain-containing protein
MRGVSGARFPRSKLVAGLCAAGALILVLALLPSRQELVVTATAYNSLPAQTDHKPNLGAWGDKILPGMPVIAVSNDLLVAGLTRGTIVRVEGFDQEFVVLDRMHRRWSNKIDIYMGNDVQAARDFGERKLRISW